MRSFDIRLVLGAALLLSVPGVFTGCQSTGGEGGQVVQNNDYGMGYVDPWYYGDYHDDHDVIVAPPPAVTPPDNGLRPVRPIARPPQVSRPMPSPRPSIPSAPRPAPRGGGRR